jgi:hypothetical protein
MKLMFVQVDAKKDASKKKKYIYINSAGCQWLISVILATQAAEIRTSKARSQSGQIVHKTLS